jgi:hypothetical protein
MILAGENRRTRRKTYPSATLSTTNPTWIDPGANTDLRDERPATNRLSHGTACFLLAMRNSIDIYKRRHVQYEWCLRGLHLRSLHHSQLRQTELAGSQGSEDPRLRSLDLKDNKVLQPRPQSTFSVP